MRKYTYLFFATCLVLLTLVVLKDGTSIGESTAVNKSLPSTMAPDFELKNLDGKTVRLSDYQGKIRIVDFWATWCPPCKDEIPHFIELAQAYPKEMVIIGISLDREGASAVIPFAKTNNINYPLLIGNLKTVQAYGNITSIPTTFVIDQQGQIVKKYVGYRDKAVFETDIQNLLKQDS